MLEFESSERSDSENIARKRLEEFGEYTLITFEGYTVKDNQVSLLLDRAKITQKTPITPSELFKEIKSVLGNQLNIKENFASKLNVPWYFVLYRDNESSIVLDMLNNGKAVVRFNTFKELAEWTMKYRQYNMQAPYHEDGLPQIDKKMRKLGTPWPGNMDKALCIDDEVVAIIEFQNTSKVTVRQHDNNNFFRPIFKWDGKLARKGDETRWKVLDEMRKHSNVPLLVIVWSKNENEVALKLVNHITYTDEDKNKAGISWGKPIYSKLEHLRDEIKKILNLES